MKKNLITIDGTLEPLLQLQIAILEKGRRADPVEIRISRIDAVREYIDCHSPLCEAGGFSLGDLLRELIRNRQTEFIGTSFCIGEEQVHPEVPETRACRTRFDVRASLRFR
ncbi:MAG: hypothetical protein WC859_03015 [Elusimicrobiota bacterium]